MIKCQNFLRFYINNLFINFMIFDVYIMIIHQIVSYTLLQRIICGPSDHSALGTGPAEKIVGEHLEEGEIRKDR